MTKKSISILSVGLVLFTFSCKQGPKVITATEDTTQAETSSGIFDTTKNYDSETEQPSAPSSDFMDNLHTVVVNETLPADKYIYLNVTENGKRFWIATRTQDITLGGTYFYREGLLKTNFESKEYQKTFDTIYLISNLVPKAHGGNTLPPPTVPDFNNTPEDKPESSPATNSTSESVTSQEGSIKIAEIVDNPEKYENKTVQITGKIVKVNPNIMNRNWYHLQDGSKDDFDLVVTSDTYVPEGHVVTIKAEVHRNVDFGAGYKYELILENGEITNR